MSTPTTAQRPLPCPFCKSPSVVCIGGGTFVHYRCGDCAEIWTAINADRAPRRPRVTAPLPPPRSKVVH